MKKVVLAAFVAVVGSSLWAENSLHWLVQDAKVDSETASFSFAAVGVNGYENFLLDPNNLSSPHLMSSASGDASSFDAATSSVIPVEYGSGDMFAVALFNDNGEIFAVSDAVSFDTLLASKYIYLDKGTGAIGAETWTVSNFHAVPEPTSGLLLLFGFAGLALRRKHV